MKKRILVDTVVMLTIFAGFFVLFYLQNMKKIVADMIKIEEKSALSDKAEEEMFDLELSYCYSVLTEEEKNIYREIYQILKEMKPETEVSTTDAILLEKVFHCVINDHPEFYYVDGFSYTTYSQKDNVVKLGFSGNYSKTLEEKQKIDAQIEVYVENCFANLKNESTDYDVAKYVYDYIILNTEYSLNAKESQNICSVFLHGKSVCMGYAKAMQYLLLRKGIVCAIVNGTTENNEEHAWNLVFLDGQAYHLDVTWGEDSYMSDEGTILDDERVNYNFFCVTTEEISKSHRIDSEIVLPKCTAIEDNYYVKEDMYFESMDIQRFEKMFQKAYEEGKEYVEMKCANDTIYQEMLTYFIEEQHIFHYLKKEKTSVTYYGDEELLLLEFWLK